MTTRKFGHTALVAVLALTILLSITGGTIAWFTDEVTSPNNVIASGNLDLEVFYGKDANLDNWTELTEASAPLFNYDLWESGYAVWQGVKLENAGSLAFKYKLNFLPNGASENKYKLEDVIDVYLFYKTPTREDFNSDDYKVGTLADLMYGEDNDGTVHGELYPADNTDNLASEVVVYVGLKMQESAGNNYQGLSVGNGFGLAVVATQYTYEKDSFDNQYDAGAEYVNTIKTFDELKKAVTEAGHYVLGADIEVPEMVEIPGNGIASIDGNGHTLTRADSYTGTILSLGEYAELELSNITLDGENVESTGNLIYIDSFGKLILNNGTVLENHVGGTTYENDPYRGPENSVIHCDGETTIVMNEGSVIQNNVAKGNFATVIMSSYGVTCELNGGKIIKNISEKNNYTVWFGNFANVTVSDGFEASGNTDGGLMRVNQSTTFTMNGGKLDGNGKAAIYTWVAKYVTLKGGEIVGDVSLNYVPATVGGTDVNGVIYKDNEVTKWALNLTPDFGTVRYSIAGNITQLNIVPAEGYTYASGDENKLVCENAGYETYWDVESGCFKVKASN